MSDKLIDKFGPNAGLIQELYRTYEANPELLEKNWLRFFESNNGKTNGKQAHEETRGVVHLVSTDQASYSSAEDKIIQLISAYRNYGHFIAKINPLESETPQLKETDLFKLNYETYGLSSSELEKSFSCSGFQSRTSLQLKQLIAELEKTYCGSIGCEINHIQSESEKTWLLNKIENRFDPQNLPRKPEQIRRLKDLIHAETFESELHKKYVGHKRFSLEGAETVIPMLSSMIHESAQQGIKEVILGMSHRGRLNVLHNIVRKPLSEIFSEFEDQNIFSAVGSGDVKYHMGFSSRYRPEDYDEELTVNLAPNPSHLEFVYPVVQGMVKAKQDIQFPTEKNKVIGILLHGDAAFIGQGVVTEALNFSRVHGYSTEGTVHLIINNQIGFTTTPDEGRSSIYCTDFAKAIDCPVFHLNCEDVDACCWAINTALEYRQKFAKDFFLDLYCYRKHGHNEGDDPSFHSAFNLQRN